MNIIVIGGTGKIGSQVVEDLATNHRVYAAGLHSGDLVCDYTDDASVYALFKDCKNIDAIVCTVGNDFLLKEYTSLQDDHFRFGCEHKLIAQIRLVRYATEYLNDFGSITLTSGYQSHFSTQKSIAVGPLNAAVDTYVRQAAPLLSRGLRLNAVSPSPIDVPIAGSNIQPFSLTQISGYYVAAVEDDDNGHIYKPWDGLYKPEVSSEFVTHAA